MRRLLTGLCLLVLISALSASTEFWTGLDFVYDMNILAEDNQEYFTGYGNGDVSEVNSIGLVWDNYLVPRTEGKHYIGPDLNLQLLFPVGYVDSDETETYISYHTEFRFDLWLGAKYIYRFRPRWGFLASLGAMHSWYKVVEENTRNDRNDVETNWVTEWAAGAELGVVAWSGRCYFNLTASALYSLFHDNGEGFKLFLKAGGGYVF